MTTIRPQPGPQRRFSQASADIVIYGGAAGGGKTYALLLEPLRYIHVPGFEATIFRRTMEQVRQTGGLWDVSSGLYPLVGGVGREHRLDWKFPSGAKVRFDQLQYEKTKNEYQGAQIALLCFDELTHFTETQFWYMLSRARSTCGVKPSVRATCNPEAESWVAKLIAWWIDPVTGLAIEERSGVVRWISRVNLNGTETIVYGETKEELQQKYPNCLPKSLTFIPAKLSDNKILCEKDPSYEANLSLLPRIERERLLGGNWKVSEESVIQPEDLVRYSCRGENYVLDLHGQIVVIPIPSCRRFAVVDTAGTSKEKAEQKKGKEASWSVCSVWDYSHSHDALMLVKVWRDRVGWIDLKAGVQATLKDFRCTKVYVENAHHGQALVSEMSGVSTELIGPKLPGMLDSHRGAKLERAISSGLLSRIEEHRLFTPADDRQWVEDWLNECTAWQGLPDEPVDQIDTASYAAHVVRRSSESWGGVVGTPWRRAQCDVAR